MGLPAENDKFISLLKRTPEIGIISISRSYANRGYSREERVYIDCTIDKVYSPAEVVENYLLEELK